MEEEFATVYEIGEQKGENEETERITTEFDKEENELRNMNHSQFDTKPEVSNSMFELLKNYALLSYFYLMNCIKVQFS